MDKLLAKKEIIVATVGFLTGLYPVVNTAYNLLYQTRCELFYHLPGKYFHSNIDNRLLYLGCILVLLLICAMPTFIKKYDEDKGKGTKGSFAYVSFLAIVIGMEMGLFNLYNLIEIMKQIHSFLQYLQFVNLWIYLLLKTTIQLHFKFLTIS